jgi:DNA-binding MltR family transcriptional regulator
MAPQSPFGSVASLSIDHLLEVLTKLDDRAAAIMAASMLETFLSAAIAYSFRRFPKEADYESIFGGSGPLATFSAKILTGYHMSVISADVRHDLKIIKNIRNNFAHDFASLSFATTHITDSCRSLKLKDAKFAPGSALAEAMPAGARGQFVGSFFNIVGTLVMQFAYLPHEKKLIAAHREELIAKAKESFARRDFGQDG